MRLVRVEVYLTEEQVKMLNELVDAGIYADLSEAVRDAIRHHFIEKYLTVKTVEEAIKMLELERIEEFFKTLEKRNRIEKIIREN